MTELQVQHWTDPKATRRLISWYSKSYKNKSDPRNPGNMNV